MWSCDSTLSPSDGTLVIDNRADAVVWSSRTNGNAGAVTSDIRSIELSPPLMTWCGDDCAQDARCRAWTCVPRGVQATGAMCRPKGAVPSAVPAAGMVSGVIQ